MITQEDIDAMTDVVKDEENRMHNLIMGTHDPTVKFHGHNVPAVTTMLIRVCDNDPKKFDEAMRLVELFIRQAEMKKS